MKSMWPPMVAIFFYDLFSQGRGGGVAPSAHLPGSATEICMITLTIPCVGTLLGALVLQTA